MVTKVIHHVLVLFGNGNHKCKVECKVSCFHIVYAKFQPSRIFELVSRVILSLPVGVTISKVTTILAHCLSTYYSLMR